MGERGSETSDFLSRVIDCVREENHRFIARLRSLDAQQWRASTLCPGWNVADVVAHMTLGARFYAHVIPAGAAGRLEMPFGATDPESFWAYREKVGEELAALSGDARTDAFAEAVWRLQEVFEGVAPEDLEKNAWHWLAPCPIRTFPGQRLYELILHDWDVQNRPNDDLPADTLSLAVECLPERFVIFFGARGDAGLSASVRFETRTPARAWTLRVAQGRAEVSDAAECDARIACGGSDLVLLTTGRARLEDLESAGRLRIEGDGAKALSVLDTLARPF